MFDLAEGVQLRPLRLADADVYYLCALRNLERLRPWFFWANDEMDLRETQIELAEMERQPEPRTNLPYGLWRGEEFGGSFGLYKIDYANRIARIGYWLDAGFEGRGLATRAVRALVQYAFSGLHLNRIEIRCAPENAGSRAVPERLGFTEEGTHRQVLGLHGGFQDLVMYAMLARDWPEI